MSRGKLLAFKASKGLQLEESRGTIGVFFEPPDVRSWGSEREGGGVLGSCHGRCSCCSQGCAVFFI